MDKAILDHNSKWFLAYTKPNQENKAELNLKNQGFITFLPKISFKKLNSKLTKLKIMFPRYIFIRVNIDRPDWHKINSTKGVNHLIKFGENIAEVPDIIIQSIKEKLDIDHIYSQKTQERDYISGEKLFIKDGQLKNKEVIFLNKKGKDRANVLLKLINTYAKADIPSSDIGKRILNEKLKL